MVNIEAALAIDSAARESPCPKRVINRMPDKTYGAYCTSPGMLPPKIFEKTNQMTTVVRRGLSMTQIIPRTDLL